MRAKKKGRFAWWGPYWKRGTFLNRRFVRGLAKIDAKAISTIKDPQVRARECGKRYFMLLQYDIDLDRRWFMRMCGVEEG